MAVEAGLIREVACSSRTAVPSSGKGRLAELMVPNDDPLVTSAAVPALDLLGEGWEASALRRLPASSLMAQRKIEKGQVCAKSAGNNFARYF